MYLRLSSDYRDEAGMKLDPALLRDVLKVDKDGEMPVTAEQWLRFPVAATPSKQQIQQAYQKQVERLKRVRGDFDLAQLRFASQQIRQAAIELNADLSAENSGGLASSPRSAAPPVPPPAPEKPLMAKPIAAPVAAGVAGAAQLEDSGVAIDTNAAVKKKRRGNVMFTWIFLAGLFACSVAVLFVLTQLQIINLYQLAGRNQQEVTGANGAAGDSSPESGTDQNNDQDKSTDANRNIPNRGTGNVGSQNTNRNRNQTNLANNNRRNVTRPGMNRSGGNSSQGNPSQGNRVQGNPAGNNVVGNNNRSNIENPNRAEDDPRSGGDSLVNAGDADLPDRQFERSPGSWKIAYKDYPIERWFRAVDTFDLAMPYIAKGKVSEVDQYIETLTSDEEAGIQQLGEFLNDVKYGSQLFDKMLRDRLHLLEQTGEFEVGGKPVSVVTCRFDNYVFRIEGVNRRFNQDSLPLGLRLAMFNGVVPVFPFDDVCVHVYKCLPYVRGNPELRSSLLRRLAETSTMEPGNLYGNDTVDHLRSFLTAGGTMSRWVAAEGDEVLKNDRQEIAGLLAELNKKQNRWTKSPENPLETIYETSVLAKPGSFFAFRGDATAQAMKWGDIPLATEMLNETVVWIEVPARTISSEMVSALSANPDLKDKSEEFLTAIEQQLKLPGNEPVVGEALVLLGNEIAKQYQRRQARKWKTQLERAREAGEAIQLTVFPPE